MSAAVLKAPFPYFGGKSRVADLVWSRLGDCDNVIEPFCGSAAFLLRRPHPPRIETINDADAMVANFWRATQHDPERVAEFADGPVNEADLHARHKWLVLSDEAKTFRKRMRAEPDYYDPKMAGWWCWGLCCWIGGGWCTHSDGPGRRPELKAQGVTVHEKRPRAPRENGNNTGGDMPGVLALSPNRKPRIDGGANQAGHGIHAKGVTEKLPKLAGGGKKTETTSYGGSHIHQDIVPGEQPHNWNRIPDLSSNPTQGGKGVCAAAGRPQLADAYDIGRGVCSNGDLGICAARRAWLVEWFGRLRDRLRLVRVCCGDWLRVCDSESVTTRLGVTGIFFDPPYSLAAGRDMKLYAKDCGKVSHTVRSYCLERGANKLMRIALCGYSGEGHEELEANGWDVVAWAAQGGYGNRSAKGKANALKERIWFSPFCQNEPTLFDRPSSDV